MKKIVKIIVAIALALMLVVASVAFMILNGPRQAISLSEKGLPTDVNLFAHRGFSGIAPENSAAAFVEAGEKGFFGAECDIQLTSDGIWILNHDDNINRMTNGRGIVSELTFEEIKEYKITSGHNFLKYRDQKIITLDEYLEICDRYDVIPQIEIKGGNNKCLDKIFEALDVHKGMREKAIIISFDTEILASLREMDSEIELWYVTSEITDEGIEMCAENNYGMGFNGNKYLKNPNGGIEKAQQLGIELGCWTIDNPDTYKSLYNLGIRNFTTNRLTK
ncbi:MAG: hypothetical protein IKV25_00765 [Clostridia bacterium]|nr:hypothetical protein [Clostridia bacterium]